MNSKYMDKTKLCQFNYKYGKIADGMKWHKELYAKLEGVTLNNYT